MTDKTFRKKGNKPGRTISTKIVRTKIVSFIYEHDPVLNKLGSKVLKLAANEDITISLQLKGQEEDASSTLSSF